MATEITLPELGENIEGGDVVDVKVSVGTDVRAGQPLVEIEAEKATVEVPSPRSGRISKVLVKKGDAVKPGQALFEIESSDKSRETKPGAAKPTPATAGEKETAGSVKPPANVAPKMKLEETRKPE